MSINLNKLPKAVNVLTKNQAKKKKTIGAKKGKGKKTMQQKLAKVRGPVRSKYVNMKDYRERKNKADLEFLAQKADLGFLQPSTQIHVPDTGSVIELIDAVIQRLAMTTEIFSYPNGIAPAYVGMYLQMAFLTYVKLYGDLTGQFAGLVPTSLDNWALPLPFAKFLQGYGKYTENGCVFRTSYVHDTQLNLIDDSWYPTAGNNVNLSLAPGTVTAQGYPYGTAPTGPPPRNLNSNSVYYMSPGLGANRELRPFPNPLPTPVPETAFSTTVFSLVAEAIASSGMAYVMGNQIPGEAPDASAYTFISEDVTSTADVHYMLSVADDFNPEIALIYSKHHPVAQPSPSVPTPSPSVYSQKCICHGMDSTLTYGAPLWYFQPTHTLVFVLSTYKKYPMGPLNHLKYCKVPLTTLYPVPQRLHFQGIANIINEHYLSVIDYWLNNSTLTTFPDLQSVYYYCYWVMVCMAFTARLNRSIPYFTYLTYINDPMGTFTEGESAIQSMFAGSGWLMHKFAPLIANLITDVGPVVYRGRLYYPQFIPRNLGNSQPLVDASPGTIWSPIINGYRSPVPAPGVPTASYFDTFMYENAQNPKSFVLHGITFDQNFALEMYETSAVNALSMFTMNFYSSLIAPMYYQFYNFISFNNTLNNSLLHLHYEKCGATHVMLTRISGSPYSTQQAQSFYNSANYDSTLRGTLQDYSTYRPNVAQVGSMVQDNAGHIALAVMYMLAWDTDNLGQVTFVAGAHSKFIIRMSASVSPNAYIQALIQETHSADSTFSKALGAREANYNDKVSEGVVTLIVPPHQDHCFVGDLFKTAVNSISSVLRYTVGAVGGAACGAGVSALGGPEFAPLATAGCSAGATRLYDYIASRVGIDASNVKLNDKAAGQGGKVTKGNVASATQELRKNVRKVGPGRVGTTQLH